MEFRGSSVVFIVIELQFIFIIKSLRRSAHEILSSALMVVMVILWYLVY